MPIEVEKKFQLPPDSLESLTKDAEFLSEKHIQDEYFDDPRWSLSQQGSFLRKRDGVWELKINRNDGPYGVRQFDETSDQREIAKHVGLPESDSFEERLRKAGYETFASYITVRKKFRLDGFTIDVDQAEYANGDTYDVVEIELLGEDPDEAEARINELAQQLGLPDEHIKGKLQYYCERHVPEQYAVMVKNGHAT